ncbi:MULTISPECIES: SDR family NAD(P)-dependent oxidoreductase [Acidiphilium]|uniref:Short-chain dehydrogenase n=1 Tax=Acidiphilium rubrum TaxID=526 RepID=A0A8G2FCI4_ACIRU|nr:MULTISPECIES: SDR family NAD(P)-dependent oxidoreductase [Acidiphilium]SIQ38383.1 Short-chain dehydrogenase [Acidiphilium rubrum]
MSQHPAFTAGRGAIITGGASGIGLATAQHCAANGMSLFLADIDQTALESARAAILTDHPGTTIENIVTDVGNRADVQRLHDIAARSGPIGLLMNNAGVEGGGGLTADAARWHSIIDTNLWGVINGVQVFMPTLMAQGIPAAIINTGSKQGITMPPGDTAYNVSKAGIKAVTEALAHDLREAGSPVTAHLLIPGFTFTGFTKKRVAEKPDAAWTPEQVVAFMAERLAQGDFYILCPDNAVTQAIDHKRIDWAAGDIIHNRPALSRWHPDYQAAFEVFVKS